MFSRRPAVRPPVQPLRLLCCPPAHAIDHIFVFLAVLRHAVDVDRHGPVQHLYGPDPDGEIRQRSLDRLHDRRVLPRPGLRGAAGPQTHHPGGPYPGLRGLRGRGHQHDPAAGPDRLPAHLAAAAPGLGHHDGDRIHGHRKLAQRTNRKPPARPRILGVHGGLRPGHGAGTAGAHALRRAGRRAAHPGGHVPGPVPGAHRRDGALAPAHAASGAAGLLLFRQARAAGHDGPVRGRQPEWRLLRAGPGLCRQAWPADFPGGLVRRRVRHRRPAVAMAHRLAVRPRQSRRPDPFQRRRAGAAAHADVGLAGPAFLAAALPLGAAGRAAVHPLSAGRGPGQ